jgi:RNA polymerase sigma-54 factor
MAVKLSTIQVQKPVLAPSLQQSITVLLLPIVELAGTIEQELQSNPFLEVDEPQPSDLENLHDIKIQDGLQRLNKELRPLSGAQNSPDDDDDSLPEPLVRPQTLEDKLLKQLHLEISDPQKLRIGEFIVGNLDENGYLAISCEEITATLEIEKTADVEAVLEFVQRFEPLGIAARDLRECLLIQLKAGQNLQKNVATRIVRDYLHELGHKKYVDIARKLKVPVEDIKEAARLIASLEPKPARNFQSSDISIYVKPDVVVRPDRDRDGEYQIAINQSDIPPLRINPLYRKLLKENSLTPEEKIFLQEKLINALNFIKSLIQRGQTIRKITEYIVTHQKDFFANGSTGLAPLCLKDVADSVKRNESTVSRAISNKYIDTPHGIYSMKFFFSQAVAGSGDNGNAPTSVQSIKEDLKELVEQEDKSSPLSDQDIQRHFAAKDLKMARRTISKYRQTLRIPPSYLRKE